MNPSGDNQESDMPVVQQPAGGVDTPNKVKDDPAIQGGVKQELPPATASVEESLYRPSSPTMTTPIQASSSNTQPATKQTTDSESVVQWEASEFVDNTKNSKWFLLLGLGAFLACIFVYLVTNSIFSVVVIALAAIAFGMVAKQKPRILKYKLFPTTLQIGDKSYSYNDFKTFSIAQDGAIQSIILQPFKRFMPPMTIYFPLEDGEKIFDVLARHIPHSEHKDDSIDKFMKQIRF